MKHLPLIIILTLLLVGCKTRVIYQPVEVPITHVELKTDTLRDSIHVRDSVTIYTKGDTVFSEKTKTVVKYRDRIHEVNKTDTITVVKPVEVPVEVEKELTAWQKAKMALGETVTVMLIAILLYYAYKIYRKWKR